MNQPASGILLIDNSLYPTGAIRSILNYASALKDQFRFVFVLPENSAATELAKNAGFKVYTLPFLEISKSLKSIFYLPRLHKNTKSVLRIIKEEQIDIVHVNDMYNMLGCAIKRKRPAMPVIYHIRLLSSSYIKTLYPYFAKAVKKYADKIICVSEAVQKDIGTTAKSCIVYDAVQINEKLPEWNGLEDARKAKILYLANFVNGKGQQYGLEAFRKISTDFPETSLHFVGGTHNAADEAFRELLRQTAIDHSIEKQVFFESSTNNVEATMKAFDIVLNLSESESFSMVSLEAMAYGVPLLVSDCGGPREITDNGRYAFLVPNKNPEAATVALRKLLQNTMHTKQLAAAGKAFVITKFNLDHNLQQLHSIYQEVTNDIHYALKTK